MTRSSPEGKPSFPWRQAEPVVETEPLSSPYVCPGEQMPVSRALHLARLHSAWPGCDQCTWRSDTEGLSEKTAAAVAAIQTARSCGLLRSEFGIRGPYLNTLNRFTLGELTGVLCDCLAEQNRERLKSVQIRQQVSSSETDPVSGGNDDWTVVAGFDARTSSPDLFAGVATAIRQFGFSLIDLGRCTAASLQHALRCVPGNLGGFHVTGAGCPPAWNGLDVFDHSGESLPVPWKRYGITLSPVPNDLGPAFSPAGTVSHSNRLSAGDPRLFAPDSIRQPSSGQLSNRASPTAENTTARSIEPHGPRAAMSLMLPPPELRSSWSRRLGRNSGHSQPVEFEATYLEWLQQWYPKRSQRRVVVVASDPLIRSRLHQLSVASGLHLILPQTTDLQADANRGFSMIVDEDDRRFCVLEANGERLTPPELASRMNLALSSGRSHVTAQADAASGRFWLTDVRPDRMPGPVIQDALATLGLLITLLDEGRWHRTADVRR